MHESMNEWATKTTAQSMPGDGNETEKKMHFIWSVELYHPLC